MRHRRNGRTSANLIETKNYPALNDVLDTMGDSKIAAALKNCRRCSAEKRFFDKASQLYSSQRIDEISY